jgi:hypothetical protein
MPCRILQGDKKRSTDQDTIKRQIVKAEQRLQTMGTKISMKVRPAVGMSC